MTTNKGGRPKGQKRTGGRPVGAPNKTTAATRKWIEDNANPVEFLADVMHGKAFKQPDERSLFTVYPTEDQRIGAAVQLLKRISPEVKPVELPIEANLAIASLDTPEGIMSAINSVTKSLLKGDITPAEANAVSGMVEKARNALATDQLAQEMQELKALIEAQG